MKTMKLYKFQEEMAQSIVKGDHVFISTGMGKLVILKRAVEILEQRYSKPSITIVSKKKKAKKK